MKNKSIHKLLIFSFFSQGFEFPL